VSAEVEELRAALAKSQEREAHWRKVYDDNKELNELVYARLLECRHKAQGLAYQLLDARQEGRADGKAAALQWVAFELEEMWAACDSSGAMRVIEALQSRLLAGYPELEHHAQLGAMLTRIGRPEALPVTWVAEWRETGDLARALRGALARKEAAERGAA
jgi:hypothetical protein